MGSGVRGGRRAGGEVAACAQSRRGLGELRAGIVVVGPRHGWRTRPVAAWCVAAPLAESTRRARCQRSHSTHAPSCRHPGGEGRRRRAVAALAPASAVDARPRAAPRPEAEPPPPPPPRGGRGGRARRRGARPTRLRVPPPRRGRPGGLGAGWCGAGIPFATPVGGARGARPAPARGVGVSRAPRQRVGWCAATRAGVVERFLSGGRVGGGDRPALPSHTGGGACTRPRRWLWRRSSAPLAALRCRPRAVRPTQPHARGVPLRVHPLCVS